MKAKLIVIAIALGLMNASAAGAIAMYHWALQHLPR